MQLSACIVFSISFLLASSAQEVEDQPLQELAPPGLSIGSVFHSSSETWRNLQYQTIALEHFSIMTASIYLPTVWIGGSDSEIRTDDFNALTDFLHSKDKKVHGHALLYPYIATLADWWNQQSLDEVEGNMYRYMKAVYDASVPVPMYSWDVVNEVMADDGNEMDSETGVRIRMFNGVEVQEYRAMGSDYVRKAFLYAKELDSTAKLLITDYACEEDDPTNDNQKSDRLYRFLKKLLEENVPVDGVGFQMHVNTRWTGSPPNYAFMAGNFRRFAQLGIEIHITEMDVRSWKTIDPVAVDPDVLRDAAESQARVFRRVLETCLEEPACVTFRFWDFAEYNSLTPTTKFSWLHPSNDGYYTFPTPIWDIGTNSFKPAWRQMQEALYDFSMRQGGVYRLTSGWERTTSYLTRKGDIQPDGSYLPGEFVQLLELTRESQTYTSLLWRLEKVKDGDENSTRTHYRIRNQWENGYLTRHGITTDGGVTWSPTSEVRVTELHMDWTSQQWAFVPSSDNAVPITCRWGNDDVLTRHGELLADRQNYRPTDQVRLQPNERFSSQQWHLERQS